MFLQHFELWIFDVSFTFYLSRTYDLFLQNFELPILMFPSDFMYMSDLFLQYYFLLQIYVYFTLHACAMTLLVPVQIYTEDVICKTHNPFDSYCRYNASCMLVCTCTAVISLVPTAKSLGTRLSCSVYTYVSKYTTTTAWTCIDIVI